MSRRRGGASRLQRAPLLLIEWEDAAGIQSESRVWHDLDDVEGTTTRVRTVGWLLAERADSITLCSSHHGQGLMRRKGERADFGDFGAGIRTIPIAGIRRRVRLLDP
jgi:hypothetical protein